MDLNQPEAAIAAPVLVVVGLVLLVWGRRIADRQARQFARIEQRFGLPPPRHQRALAPVVGGVWFLVGVLILAMMFLE